MRAVKAARLAIQLTIMKPPRIHSQLTPSIARAIRSASPLSNSMISTAVNAMIAPNR